MEFLIKQLGRIKKFSTFIIALAFILSLSWFADGLSGIISKFSLFLFFISLLFPIFNLSFWFIGSNFRKFLNDFILILAVLITILTSISLLFKLVFLVVILGYSLIILFLYIMVVFGISIKSDSFEISPEMVSLLSLAFSVINVFLFALLFWKVFDDRDSLLTFIQFSFSLSVFLIGWLYLKNFEFSFSVKEVKPKDIKGLIMFLSNWDKNSNKCPWEMQLKVLEEYSLIKYVYVIGSKSSYYQISQFESLVKKFFKDITIISHKDAIDFENLEESIKAIEEGFKCLKEKRLKDSQILIETTGGQKIQSIAGAFFSSTYDRYFVYVSTNTKEVKVFDVVYTGGEG
ncbi:MAG: hypothetical protein RQ990_07835 [Candidatus Hydrothermia bacterium]|jgi:hypothetical protein|nr:hypothetical protein [Candidatus Hydrothermia bacterium]